jgi:hypothetical protein
MANSGEEQVSHRLVLEKIPILFAYLVLFGSAGLCLFALLTLHLPLLAFLAAMVILQLPIGKSPKLTAWIGKYLHPSQYFRSFTFLNDCADPPRSGKCIYAFHPHSIYAFGLLCSMNNPQSESFKDMVGISSNFILNVPIAGLMFRLWGVSSASGDNLKALMAEGRNIGLLPGGF